MNEYHEKVRITKRYPKNSENDPISGKIRTSEENQKDLQISEVFLVFRKIWPPCQNLNCLILPLPQRKAPVSHYTLKLVEMLIFMHTQTWDQSEESARQMMSNFVSILRRRRRSRQRGRPKAVPSGQKTMFPHVHISTHTSLGHATLAYSRQISEMRLAIISPAQDSLKCTRLYYSHHFFFFPLFFYT